MIYRIQPCLQVLLQANTLLSRYSDGRWVVLLVTVNRDRGRFEALHQAIEAHVNDIVRCVLLRQARFAPLASYSGTEMAAVAAKVQELTGCGQDMQEVNTLIHIIQVR